LPKKPTEKKTEFRHKDLRLPAWMLDAIGELAKKNRRTMTAEIELAVFDRLNKEGMTKQG
jgi:hypothetical protein